MDKHMRVSPNYGGWLIKRHHCSTGKLLRGQEMSDHSICVVKGASNSLSSRRADPTTSFLSSEYVSLTWLLRWDILHHNQDYTHYEQHQCCYEDNCFLSLQFSHWIWSHEGGGEGDKNHWSMKYWLTELLGPHSSTLWRFVRSTTSSSN